MLLFNHNLFNMKNKRMILTSLVLFQMAILFSQKIEFTYDANGNRITRTLTVEQLRTTVEFPVIDAKTLRSFESITGSDIANFKEATEGESEEEKLRSEDDEIVTVVYPNPNIGILKIDISNMPISSKNELRLYDLNGLQKLEIKNFESHTEIDISHLRDGIYILRIKINESIFDWKVVKSHD